LNISVATATGAANQMSPRAPPRNAPNSRPPASTARVVAATWPGCQLSPSTNAVPTPAVTTASASVTSVILEPPRERRGRGGSGASGGRYGSAGGAVWSARSQPSGSAPRASQSSEVVSTGVPFAVDIAAVTG